MVKRLINALDSLTTSLLRSKVSFEEASEFSTPKLTVNLKSFTVSDAGGEVRVGFANFKLPGGSNMFLKGMTGLTSVNQKVSRFSHLLGNRMMMMMMRTTIMTLMLLLAMMTMINDDDNDDNESRLLHNWGFAQNTEGTIFVVVWFVCYPLLAN